MTPAWNAAKFNLRIKSMNHDFNSMSTPADYLTTCFETRTKDFNQIIQSHKKMNSESNDHQWLTCHKSFGKRIPRGEKRGYQSKIKSGNNWEEKSI